MLQITNLHILKLLIWDSTPTPRAPPPPPPPHKHPPARETGRSGGSCRSLFFSSAVLGKAGMYRTTERTFGVGTSAVPGRALSCHLRSGLGPPRIRCFSLHVLLSGSQVTGRVPQSPPLQCPGCRTWRWKPLQTLGDCARRCFGTGKQHLHVNDFRLFFNRVDLLYRVYFPHPFFSSSHFVQVGKSPRTWKQCL